MLPIEIFGFTITRGKEPELVEPNMSPAQELALLQGRHAAREQLRTVSVAKLFGWFVLIIVMVISYDEQRAFLADHHANELGERLIPIAFDFATVYFVTVIGAKAMRRAAVYTSCALVFFPVGASAYINASAAADRVMFWIQGAVSLLIPAIEIVKALLGADFRRLRADEKEYMQAATAPLEEPAAKPAKKKNAKRGDKRELASDVMNRNPKITAAELAAMTGISVSYASKLYRELKGETVSV